jgi:hypothetical protein
VFNEKLHDIGATLEHTPSISLKRLAQETGVVKSSARTAKQLLELSSGSWCLVGCKWTKDYYTCVFLTEPLTAKDIYVHMDSAFGTAFLIPPVIIPNRNAETSTKLSSASRPAVRR